jgi:hypothetical protein
MKQLL